jgi:hypothetical protein
MDFFHVKFFKKIRKEHCKNDSLSDCYYSPSVIENQATFFSHIQKVREGTKNGDLG